MNKTEAYKELEHGVFTALETYSNVHRGSGYNSMISTHLYEQARDIVLKYLGISKAKYIVIFCSPGGEVLLKAGLKPGSYLSISSREIGLQLGVRAVAIKRKALPKGAPFRSGGGTTTLISPDWVIWANPPDKFEAGTPAIINVIAFAKALLLIQKYGIEIFNNVSNLELLPNDILYNDELEKYTGRELLNKLRETLIGRENRFPTTEGFRPYTNLDNSASTPTFIPIWNAVRNTWLQPYEKQQKIIPEVKSICSQTLGAPQDKFDMIFTLNTTEAINLAAESLSKESERGIEPAVLITMLEHTSNELPWRSAPNIAIERLPVDNDGFLDLNVLETVLSAYNQKGQYGNKRIRIMALSGASNVLGSLNDLNEISLIVHKYGASLLVDAAQLVAHHKIDMNRCNIDYLTFSAHKVYAPFGTGVLVFRRGLLNFNSAEMEEIKSSGEENAGGIAALGKALLLIGRIGLDVIREEEQELTGKILNRMSKIEGIKIYGVNNPDSPRFPRKGGVIVFTLKGFMSDKVAKELAFHGGIGIRYGCHCAHILVKHILGVPAPLERFQRIIAILFPRLRFPGVARVSLGLENTEEDVDRFIKVLGKIATKTTNLKQKEVKRQINDSIKAAAVKVY